ncbi:MAG: KpsF/GutQ family sugar-phosphate isomerase [Synergistetes bacterium]|nr:KpsF/GutQ family sugar-phosphate isomerase [Synergistota bacterium]
MVSDKELLEEAKRVLELEAKEILRLRNRLGEEVVRAAKLILSSTGRVVVMGMGKSGLIGRKISATLSSLGTPSFFLHPAEALHGDLGMVRKEDVGLILSNSGETREVLAVIPYLRRIGSRIIAFTGRRNSTLAKEADIVLNTFVEREACPLGLAPTSSTAVMLALGDALAVLLAKMRGLREEDFALVHPDGSLGRKLLLRVEDLMHTGREIPMVSEKTLLKDALFEMTSKGFGTILVEREGRLVGILTDGDLRRLLERFGYALLDKSVGEVMIHNPKRIAPEKLAAQALALMEKHEISVLPVVDRDNKIAGIIHIHDLLKAGIA